VICLSSDGRYGDSSNLTLTCVTRTELSPLSCCATPESFCVLLIPEPSNVGPSQRPASRFL
jgi:hypothetical protein